MIRLSFIESGERCASRTGTEFSIMRIMGFDMGQLKRETCCTSYDGG